MCGAVEEFPTSHDNRLTDGDSKLAVWARDGGSIR